MRESGAWGWVGIETLKAGYEEGWKRLREIAFVLGGDADADPVRVAEGLRGRCEALAQKGVEAEERRLADEQTIRNLEAMVVPLRQTWRGVWRLFTGGRTDVSWHDVLEHAEAAGLVARVAYGPDVKDQFEIVGGDCEEGDLVWVPTALGRSALGEGAAR